MVDKDAQNNPHAGSEGAGVDARGLDHHGGRGHPNISIRLNVEARRSQI